MNIIDIIDKKRQSQILTKEEIEYFVSNFVSGDIEKYQMSALLMAITINGMNEQETIDLTDAMIASGDVINFGQTKHIIVDKHSTGGIGDKVTLVLIPLLASLGIKVAKLSGRGLGYTGGTIDKLESIPGFNVELTERMLKEQVDEIGVAISSQSDKLVPADKLIYALRDVTGTVESIPLIASSIMSKKIATGADMIIIDITVGEDALIKDLDSARKLAKLMIKIGKKYNKVVICILTNMDEPLGYAIGNALEVEETINALKGNAPSDLLEVVMTMACIALMPIKKISIEDARMMIFDQLNNGQAYNKFLQLVRHQGGDIELLKVSDKVLSVRSTKQGYINDINALKLGKLSCSLGAGRMTTQDDINHEVGIVLSKKTGDKVEKNEELLKIYIGDKDVNINDFVECFKIESELTAKPTIIYDIIK